MTNRETENSAAADEPGVVVAGIMRRESVVVYLGPSLPRQDAARLLDAAYRPPARRGDIHRALRHDCRTIVLIDGEFHGRPSVWQREILDAVAEGTQVHGAASMGALRAAELHTLGMIGHGRIFEWYRDGIIDGDDEVALTYGPAALGYRAISEPLVNIRATLGAAVPQVISADEHDQLIAYAKGLYFPDRSYATLLDAGPAADWGADRRAALRQFLSRARIDQKRCDAVAALRSVAQPAPAGDKPISRRPPANAFWRRERLVAEGIVPSIAAIDPMEAARAAGLRADELPTLRRELAEIYFVATWGRDHGITAGRDDVAQARGGLTPAADLSPRRVELLLAARAAAHATVRTVMASGGSPDPVAARRAVILDWARENGISHAALRGTALVEWIVSQGPNHFGYLWNFGVELIDELRLRGYRAPFQSEASG
jgi:hypothetical protein